MVSTPENQISTKVASKRKSTSAEDCMASKRCCLEDPVEFCMELGEYPVPFDSAQIKHQSGAKKFLPVYSHHGGTSGTPADSHNDSTVSTAEMSSNEVEMSDSQPSDSSMVYSFTPTATTTPIKSDRFSHGCGKESPKGNSSGSVCCMFATHYVSDIY